jgi:cellulose synthase/poly-beta-1,6-N-acetylglucosamine synthase-like glycosyltransferase
MAAVHERVVHGLSYRLKGRARLNVPLGVGMCIGTGVLSSLGEWPALSLGEDIELYLILTGKGVRIQAVPDARIVAQETSSLRQSAMQRHRWTRGRIQVLRRRGLSLLFNRDVHPHQRLDTIAEVSSFGPVVQLGLATFGVLATLSLQPPGSLLLVAAFAVSLLRLAIYTVAAVSTDPHPWKAVSAFAYLPVYALWRNWTLLKGLIVPGSGEWKRTERHSPGNRR